MINNIKIPSQAANEMRHIVLASSIIIPAVGGPPSRVIIIDHDSAFQVGQTVLGQFEKDCVPELFIDKPKHFEYEDNATKKVAFKIALSLFTSLVKDLTKEARNHNNIPKF